MFCWVVPWCWEDLCDQNIDDFGSEFFGVVGGLMREENWLGEFHGRGGRLSA